MSGGVVIQNQVIFFGVPYVTGDAHIFPLTNTHANISQVGINPVNADVAINSAIAIDVTNPVITVGRTCSLSCEPS
jgi:hypothetical protein